MIGAVVSSVGDIVQPGSSIETAISDLDTSLSNIRKSIGIIGEGGNDYFKVNSINDELNHLSVIQDGQKLVYSRKTYDRHAPVVIPNKSVDYIMDGAKFNVLSNTQAIYARSGVVGLFILSANYVPGSLELIINVTSGVLSNYYKRGRWAKIVSNAVDPTNRNEGSQANQWRVGEWFLIYDIDDVNNKLILGAPLKYWQGLDGQLNPSDPSNRPVVESYTVTNNARVFTTTSVDINIYGCEIEYEEGHEGPDGWSSAAVDIAGYQGFVVDGLRIHSGYGMGISTACFGSILRDIRCDYLADFSRVGGSASLGYGIGDGGSGTTVIAPRMFNTRHGYTTTGSSGPLSSTNAGILLGWGKTTNNTIINGAGVSNFGHTALKINTDNNILGILNGVIELDEGIFSDNRVGYSDAFIRAVNGTVGTDGTKTPSTGSFLKWQNTDGQFVFEVDKDGLIYQRSATGQQLFATDISGNLLLGSTAVSQRQLRLYTSATEYYLQGVSSGNYLRFRDNTVGKDLMKIYGVSGDVDIEGNIKPTIDDSKSLGTAALRYSVTYSTKHCYTATVCDYAGNGSPEGSLSSSVGSTYRRIDGGASTTFYVKESGSGNTGWVAK